MRHLHALGARLATVVAASAGTSAEVIAQLNREIDLYLKGPEIQARLLTLGLVTDAGGAPESTAQIIDKEQAHWRALAKKLNVEPQ